MAGPGKRGRPRKPAALKVFEGNPGKRAVAEEPKGRQGVPTMPAKVKADVRAAKWWRWAVGELKHMNIVTKADRMPLELAALDYSMLCRVDDEIRRRAQRDEDTGLTCTSGGGAEYQSPLVGIANQCKVRLMRYCSELGLTPVSRTQLDKSNAGDVQLDLFAFAGIRDDEPPATRGAG